MILGFFFVRPVPLPEEELNHENNSVTSSSAYDQSYTPLLNYDPHINEQGDDGAGIELTPSSHRETYRGSLNRGETMAFDMLPNIHGKKLWCSSDFWLLFGILSIRMLPAYYNLCSSLIFYLLVVSGIGVMCASFQKDTF